MKKSTKIVLLVGALILIYVIANLVAALGIALPRLAPVFLGPMNK